MESLQYIARERIKDHHKEMEIKEREARRQTTATADSAVSNKGVKKRFKVFSVRGGMDMPFFFLVILLLVVGMVMMFSASYAYAYYTMGDSYYYLLRQAVFAVIGVGVMIAVSFFDYHHFHRLALIVLAIAFGLLVLVLFMPAVNEVHRWINLGIFSFQASEVLKFAVILFYAHWSSIYFEKMDTFRYGVMPAVAIAVPSIILLIMEPHYSCIVIIALLLAVMMWCSGVKSRWFAIGVGGVVSVFLILQMTGLLKYAMERLKGWGMALEPDLSTDMQNLVWQTKNSLYAIGSGGLTGMGIGQSRQKYLYLPEPQNDFVFAVVIEELGLIGGIIILTLFALLVIRGILVSLRAKDRFGMLLGTGLTAQIGLQVVLNILVITDTLPNTGISLPFFSYGGSSLVMLLAQMGIVLSVSRSANINKT
ncbi:MAG: putative peptidoglycan glycosyltransferase FtsW [Acutalibacteraceae bacterium]